MCAESGQRSGSGGDCGTSLSSCDRSACDRVFGSWLVAEQLLWFLSSVHRTPRARSGIFGSAGSVVMPLPRSAQYKSGRGWCAGGIG